MYELWKRLQTEDCKNMKECTMESCRTNVYFGGRHICMNPQAEKTCPYHQALITIENLRRENIQKSLKTDSKED